MNHIINPALSVQIALDFVHALCADEMCVNKGIAYAARSMLWLSGHAKNRNAPQLKKLSGIGSP